MSLRTGNIRAKTFEIERLASRGGNGSRARLNEAVRNAERIIEEVIASEGRFINAVQAQHAQHEQHEPQDQRAAGHRGLDVVA